MSECQQIFLWSVKNLLKSTLRVPVGQSGQKWFHCSSLELGYLFPSKILSINDSQKWLNNLWFVTVAKKRMIVLCVHKKTVTKKCLIILKAWAIYRRRTSKKVLSHLNVNTYIEKSYSSGQNGLVNVPRVPLIIYEMSDKMIWMCVHGIAGWVINTISQRVTSPLSYETVVVLMVFSKIFIV